jgi:hypothetical protein
MTEQMKLLTAPSPHDEKEQEMGNMLPQMMMMQMQLQMCKMNASMMEMVDDHERERKRASSPSPPPSPPHRAFVMDLCNLVVSEQDMADFEEWKAERARERERKAEEVRGAGGSGV